MPKIMFIKPDTKHKRVQLGVACDDGNVSVLNIKENTYTSVGAPNRGDEIPDAVLSDLLFENEIYTAFRKTLSYIADHDRSRYELKMKLFQAGFSKEAVDIALDKCEEYGYLDESRQLERLVEREANRKLRGRQYIKRVLAAKGYRISQVERAINKLVENGEIDFDENFALLVEKRGATEEEKIMALRYRYGYGG